MSYKTEHRTKKTETMLKRKNSSNTCLGTHTVEYSRPKPLWEPLRTPRETLGLEYSTVWVPKQCMLWCRFFIETPSFFQRGVSMKKQRFLMKKAGVFDEKSVWFLMKNAGVFDLKKAGFFYENSGGLWWQMLGLSMKKAVVFDEKNVGFLMKKRGFSMKKQGFFIKKT